jgi:hypothetical protein
LLSFVDEPPKREGANRFKRDATRGGHDRVPTSDDSRARGVPESGPVSGGRRS